MGFVREMEGAARRALGWILDHADRGWEDQELAREIRVDAEALR